MPHLVSITFRFAPKGEYTNADVPRGLLIQAARDAQNGAGACTPRLLAGPPPKLCWVAVEELKLSYHNEYIYI